MTGVTGLNAELLPKKLELLHELVPAATVVVALVNPANPTPRPVEGHARRRPHPRSFTCCMRVAKPTSPGSATLVQLRAGGLLIGVRHARLRDLASIRNRSRDRQLVADARHDLSLGHIFSTPSGM
jgi:hypothetical protein